MSYALGGGGTWRHFKKEEAFSDKAIIKHHYCFLLLIIVMEIPWLWSVGLLLEEERKRALLWLLCRCDRTLLTVKWAHSPLLVMTPWCLPHIRQRKKKEKEKWKSQLWNGGGWTVPIGRALVIRLRLAKETSPSAALKNNHRSTAIFSRRKKTAVTISHITDWSGRLR